jgi:hypothetical protein
MDEAAESSSLETSTACAFAATNSNAHPNNRRTEVR